MTSTRRPWLAIALTLSLAVAAAACGSDDSTGSAPAAAAAEASGGTGTIGATTPVAQAVTIIDVRTPEEFAAGHLAGAVNLSLETGALQAALPTLDRNASYEVYCRTGRRSAIAAELMAAAGFADLRDLGAMDAAAASTGRAVVGP